MKVLKHKRFKAISIIQLVWAGLFMLLCLLGLLVNVANTNRDDLVTIGLFFLVLTVHVGNNLYNLRLIKVMTANDSPPTFNRTLSIVLLLLHILAAVMELLIIGITLWQLSQTKPLLHKLIVFYYCFTAYMGILALLSIWSIVTQITWLRSFKKRQQSASEQLLASIGHTAQDM
jgi:uncharacterized membrane protein